MSLIGVVLIVLAIIIGVALALGRGARIAALPALGWSGVGILALFGILVGFFGGIWGLVPGVPALLLFGLMAVLTVKRGTGEGWFLPFAWILIVPAVTVPMHIGLLGVITDGYHHEGASASGGVGACTQVNQDRYDKLWHCPLEAAVPTLLPGLLNLAPFLGLSSPARRVRYAGVVAGSLGALRLLIPVAIYGADAPDIDIIGSWQWPPAMGSLASGYSSVGLWFVSLAVAAAFAMRTPAAEEAARPAS